MRCLVRDGSNNKAVEGRDVELFIGDLRNDKDIEKMVKGCTYVYHCAAFVSIRHGDREDLFKVNIEGTKKLMEACLREKVTKVVYCSSFGAIRNVAPGVSDEESTFSPYEMTTDYEVSKGFAEGEVCSLSCFLTNLTSMDLLSFFDFARLQTRVSAGAASCGKGSERYDRKSEWDFGSARL